MACERFYRYRIFHILSNDVLCRISPEMGRACFYGNWIYVAYSVAISVYCTVPDFSSPGHEIFISKK